MMAKICTLVLIFFGLFVCAVPALRAQTTEFTYQGSLKDNTAPANGNYDFEFRLYDAVSGGNQVGLTVVVRNNVVVTSGIFSVTLDFGGGLIPFFPGADRYLDIRVRSTGGGAFTALLPRNKIGSSPYALQSLNAANAGSANTAGNVTGVVQIANGGTGSTTKNFVDLTTNQTNIAGNKTFTGILSGNGSGLTNVNAAVADGSITTSKLADGSVTSIKLAPDVVLGGGLSNADLLAMKRWDQLREMRVFALTVPVNDLVWDGQTFWILDTAANSVHKLSVGAFTVAGTFPVGTQPTALVFDGANIWTANTGSSNLTKLRASDGANLGTFPVGTPPRRLVFDGINIWANVGNPATQVAKVRVADGVLVGTFNCSATLVLGFDFDGANIWCAGVLSLMQKIRALDGVGSSMFSIDTTSLLFDGKNMWRALAGQLTRLSGSGSPLNNYTTCSDRAMAFDGTDVLVICTTSQQIFRHSTADGSVIAIYSLPFEPGSRWAFDGKNIWISNAAPGDRLVRLPPPIR